MRQSGVIWQTLYHLTLNLATHTPLIVTGFPDGNHNQGSHILSTTAGRQELKRTLIARYARPEDRQGYTLAFTTLIPLATLWYGAASSTRISYWLTAGGIVLMSLFLLRAFVLMHECGHGSLFRTQSLNRAFGFLFGVITGMPQYVWSRHHQHHHSTNGNWAQYRGPLNVIPVDEYAAMTARQQRRFRYSRNIWLTPVAGFIYLILAPRINLLKGSAGLFLHIIRGKLAQPGVAIATLAPTFKTPCWSSMREYQHMLWNSSVLFVAWGMMAWLVGPLLFLVCYVISVSLAGAAGILLFTVQHNFEHSYASLDEGWDSTTAALTGTSFLQLPHWLNWFTANIAYHHIHHLSSRIPAYRLAACHDQYRHLFAGVTRISLTQIPRAFKYILWDTLARRIVSVADYQHQLALSAGR